MPNIILLLIIVFSAGTVGYLISPKEIKQEFQVKSEAITYAQTYTTVYTLQGQITIVDTTTNINFNINSITNLIKEIVITNKDITNYTNLMR